MLFLICEEEAAALTRIGVRGNERILGTNRVHLDVFGPLWLGARKKYAR
jgi:hypothetical protein